MVRKRSLVRVQLVAPYRCVMLKKLSEYYLDRIELLGYTTFKINDNTINIVGGDTEVEIMEPIKGTLIISTMFDGKVFKRDVLNGYDIEFIKHFIDKLFMIEHQLERSNTRKELEDAIELSGVENATVINSSLVRIKEDEYVRVRLVANEVIVVYKNMTSKFSIPLEQLVY